MHKHKQHLAEQASELHRVADLAASLRMEIFGVLEVVAKAGLDVENEDAARQAIEELETIPGVLNDLKQVLTDLNVDLESRQHVEEVDTSMSEGDWDSIAGLFE